MSKAKNGTARKDPGEEPRHGHHISPKYSNLRIVLANLPYAVMVLVGMIIIALALGLSSSAWTAAGGYVVYGVVGALWIIVFLCPYCPSYGQRSCPCGYGLVSARLQPKGDTELFKKKFRQHIPVIVPLWLIPVLVGGARMLSSFSWPLAVLLGVFVLDSFVILPLISKRHGCKYCPQRGACPWMAG